MSEIDRVFARLGGGQPAAGEQRETRNVPRRGTTGSRVVEVVRLPSRRSETPPDQAPRPAHHLRAASWEDGFPARTTAPAAPAPPPPVAKAPEPIAHVMPAWEPSAAEPEAEAPPPAPDPAPRRRGRPRKDAAPLPARPQDRPEAGLVARPARRVADPFDAADEGTNCLRCGYLVEPAREARGLLTCASCAA